MWKSLALLLLIIAKPSFAAITVVTENFPNFQYQNEQGELVGSVVGKVKAALEKSGMQYDISINTWSITYNAALRDANTCIFSLARIPSREKKFKWIHKLEGFSASFYAFKSNRLSINNLDDAKKYRTAVLKNNYSHVYLKEQGFNENKQLILLDSFENIYDILKSRRTTVDLVVLSDQQYQFESKNDQSLSFLEPVYQLPVARADLYFACNGNIDPVTLDKLNKAFVSSDLK
ncbi:substrate-binding periplasmic protein [Pseudoalteromonas sp. SSMSWG5]|jgi:polar amino acid transport system substrate-binding protein|uniref:substrate-binding periplasmic protein n=1 Tax=unclassified Pseudoalteromonas TaxID=194690 RepID=UPI0011081506|nr:MULTISPECIES: transporter substrate-binding domain-containing protein [unclassified Pseudoalteromonas]TMO47666.1 amino acid ABC transporter substrate-binding protein [Pseudoalteromonas sp. S4389]